MMSWFTWLRQYYETVLSRGRAPLSATLGTTPLMGQVYHHGCSSYCTDAYRHVLPVLAHPQCTEADLRAGRLTLSMGNPDVPYPYQIDHVRRAPEVDIRTWQAQMQPPDIPDPRFTVAWLVWITFLVEEDQCASL